MAAAKTTPVRFRGNFEGLWTFGFETNIFQPDGGVVLDPNGREISVRAAWITGSESVLEHIRAKIPRLRGKHRVRLRGVLKGPGRYGHLGGADYQLELLEILEVSAPTYGEDLDGSDLE